MIYRFKTYILTTFFILFILAFAYMYEVTPILNYVSKIYETSQNIYVLIPALISSIILLKQGGYWLYMIICASVDAAYICYDAGVGMSNMSFFILNAITFLVIAFIINTIIAFLKG